MSGNPNGSIPRSPIRVAVIPAAGQGTRMLPATKAVPKELLPILERPALQIVVDEAVGAGVDHVVIVTSRSKPAIEHYFARSTEVEDSLEAQGRGALAQQLRRYGNDITVSFVYQDSPRGLGGLVAETGTGAVALKRVPADETSRYGIVTPLGAPVDRDGWETLPMGHIVEKPAANPPSDLAIIGRYALTPDIFDDLEIIGVGSSGEIQLTDALSRQADRVPLHGVVSRIGRRDVGNPLGWIEAVVEHGLRHPEIGPHLRTFLRTTLN